MKLKPLDQFNASQSAVHFRMAENSPRPNGIACPTCGKELLDSQPNVTLTSWPPQAYVHCPGCGHRGTRVA